MGPEPVLNRSAKKIDHDFTGTVRGGLSLAHCVATRFLNDKPAKFFEFTPAFLISKKTDDASSGDGRCNPREI